MLKKSFIYSLIYLHMFATTFAIAKPGGGVVVEESSVERPSIRKPIIDGVPPSLALVQRVAVSPNPQGFFDLHLTKDLFDIRTDLVLEHLGNAVGHVFFRGSSINFFAKEENFNLQTPLDVRSLYVRTKGNFMFEGPVRVKERSVLQARNITLLEKWFGDNSSFEVEERFCSKESLVGDFLDVSATTIDLENVTRGLSSLDLKAGMVTSKKHLISDLLLSIEGLKILLKGKTQAQDIKIHSAESTEVDGIVYSGGNLTLQSDQTLVQKGDLVAKGKTVIKSRTFETVPGAKSEFLGSVTLKGGSFHLGGKTDIRGPFLLEETKAFENDGALTAHNVFLGKTDSFSNHGALEVHSHFLLSTEEFLNNQRMSLAKQSSIETGGRFLNRGHIQGSEMLQVKGKALENQGTIESPLAVEVETVIDNKGLLKGALSLSAQRINNRAKMEGEEIVAKADVLETGGSIDFLKAFNFFGHEFINRGSLTSDHGLIDLLAKNATNFGSIKARSGQIREFETFKSGDKSTLTFEDTLVVEGKNFGEAGLTKGKINAGFLTLNVQRILHGGIIDVPLVMLINANAGEFRGTTSCGWGSINTTHSLKIPSEAVFKATKHLTFNAQSSLEFHGAVHLKQPNATEEQSIWDRIKENPALFDMTKRMPLEITMIGNTQFTHRGRIVSAYTPVRYKSNGTFTYDGRTQSGYFESNATTIQAMDAALKGDIVSYGLLAIQTTDKLFLGGTTRSHHLAVTAGSVDVEGSHRATGTASIQAKNLIKTEEKSSVHTDATLSLKAKNIEHRGILESKALLALEADEDIYTYYLSKMLGQDTSVRAGDTFTNIGIIKAEKSFSARAKYIANLGIIAASSARFNADRLFFNGFGGLIHSDDLTINAGVSLNILGGMHARNTMTINNLIDLNLGGIRSAYNLSTNSLFSFNGGLNLPSIPTLKYFVSWHNGISSALSIVRMIDPTGIARVANLAWDGYNVVTRGQSLYQQIQSTDFSGYGVSDWIELSLGIKSLAMSVNGLRQSGINAFDKIGDTEALWNSIDGDSWHAKIANIAIDTFGSRINNDTLFGADVGGNVAGSVYQRGLYGYSGGFVAAGAYTNDLAFTGVASGRFYTKRTNLSGRNYTFNGKAKGRSFSLIAKNRASVDGDVRARNVSARGKFGSLNGRLRTNNFSGKFEEHVDANGDYGACSDGKRLFVLQSKTGTFGGTFRDSGYSFNVEGHADVLGTFNGVRDSYFKMGSGTLGGKYADSVGIRFDVAGHADVSHEMERTESVSLKAGSSNLGGSYKDSKGIGFDVAGHADVSHEMERVESVGLTAGSANLGGSYKDSKGIGFDVAGDAWVDFVSDNLEGMSLRAHELGFADPEQMRGKGFDISADIYEGGVDGVLDLAQRMGADEVAIHARGYDFKALKGFGFTKTRHLHFRNIHTHGKIDSREALTLEADQDFRADDGIRSKGDLVTIARNGKHETAYGAVLESTEGRTGVFGKKGVYLTSSLQNHRGKKYLKIAAFKGATGLSVESDGNFHLGSNALDAGSGTLSLNILGDIIDGRTPFSRDQVSGFIRPDGTDQGFAGNGENGYVPSSFSGDFIEGFVGGSFSTDAGQFSFKRGGDVTAIKGFNFNGFSETYVAASGERSKGPGGLWGKEKWYQEGTDFYHSILTSSEGGFSFRSPEGGMSFMGTQFLTRGTNTLVARDNIRLNALRNTENHKTSDSTLFHLRRKSDEGNKDVSQVSSIVGFDKLYMHSTQGKITGEGAQLYAHHGGRIYGEKGVQLSHLYLDSDFKRKDRGLYVDHAGKQGVASMHPIGRAIHGLAHREDGTTGLLTDCVDLFAGLMNVGSSLAKNFLSGGGLLGAGEILNGELGLTRVGMGLTFVNESGKEQRAQFGSLASKGVFEIGAGAGHAADLRGSHLELGGVIWDTNKILLGGAREHREYKRNETTFGVSFDAKRALLEDAMTAGWSGSFAKNRFEEIRDTSEHAQIAIGSMHFKRAAEVTLEDGIANIGTTSGEKYTMRVIDNQDVIQRKGYHLNFSTSVTEIGGESVTRAQVNSIGLGWHNTTDYKTAKRSLWSVKEGNNLASYSDMRHQDRTTGGGFSFSRTSSLDSDVLSMPVTISGQVGDSRFRIHPSFSFRPENLPTRRSLIDMNAVDDTHNHPEEKNHDDDDLDLPPTEALLVADFENREEQKQAILGGVLDKDSTLPEKLSMAFGFSGGVNSLGAVGEMAGCGTAAAEATLAWPVRAATGAGAAYFRSGNGGNSQPKKESRAEERKESSDRQGKGPQIPSEKRLRFQDIKKNTNIGLERFSAKGKNGTLRDPKTNFEIRPDRGRSSGAGGHGGSHWKLFDGEHRIATLDEFGRILRVDK